MLDKLNLGGMMPGGEAEQQKPPPIAEFEGRVECPLFSETCKITLEKDGLSLVSRFQQLPVLYGEIHSIESSPYSLSIQTACGQVSFSQMGPQLEWLTDKLKDAYNDAVASALLATGDPVISAAGSYAAEEYGSTHQGDAEIRLYEDCLCILPPNENARRLPLCFLTGAEKSGYSLTLTLSTGEKYTLSRLGRELDPLDDGITKQLRALREKTAEWHKKLAPSLGGMQAAMAGSLMPMGRASDFGKLQAAVPPMSAALEQKLKESRVANYLPWLRELCGGEGLMVGALPPPVPAEGASPGEGIPANLLSQLKLPLLQQQGETAGEGEEVPAEPAPILWLMAPDIEGGVAAVELALADNEAAATYLYRIEGEWERFAAVIDRALEAAGFQREPIFLSEEKLSAPEHINDALLIKRTPAIMALRRCFAGRAVHSSLQRWKNDIEKCRATAAGEAAESAPAQQQKVKFCTNCGNKLSAEAKFCGECGAKQN